MAGGNGNADGDGAFQCAATELQEAGQSGRISVSDSQKLQFYALFKQATQGDCDKPQPSAFRPVERAKWTAWQQLHGTQPESAKQRYVTLVRDLLPAPAPIPAVPVHSAERRRSSRSRGPLVPTRPMATTVRSPAAAASYMAIMLQLVAIAMTVAGAMGAAVYVLLPLCDEHVAPQLQLESCQPVKALASLLWFAGGYLLVLVLRNKMISWQLVAGAVVSHKPSSHRHRRVRRRRTGQDGDPIDHAAADAQDEVAQLASQLQERGVRIVHEPESAQDRWITPRVELTLPPAPDARTFGHCTTELPFTLEQTANMYYRKFKEPLPDPASHLLLALEDVDEMRLNQWDAVYRRRIMRFRNATPYVIKRFANSEFVEYEEHSLLDKRNRVFYVYVMNKSFASLGTIEDYSIYHVADGKPEWTTLTQSARVRITSSSVGFFRSQIESFIATAYEKQAPLTRQYHLQRLVEEFGESEGLESHTLSPNTA